MSNRVKIFFKKFQGNFKKVSSLGNKVKVFISTMNNRVMNLLKKTTACIWKEKKWLLDFIVSTLTLVILTLTFLAAKETLFRNKQVLKPIRIRYENAKRFDEFKRIDGKKVHIIKNELIDIAKKMTFPEGYYIGFLIIEVERDVNLSITNLEIPINCQINNRYKEYKDEFLESVDADSSVFVKFFERLDTENSIFVNDTLRRKSLSPDEIMLFPFCITFKIEKDEQCEKIEFINKTHELFNNANHILMYYHINEIKYKTNDRDKWQYIPVEKMETVIFFDDTISD